MCRRIGKDKPFETEGYEEYFFAALLLLGMGVAVGACNENQKNNGASTIHPTEVKRGATATAAAPEKELKGEVKARVEEIYGKICESYNAAQYDTNKLLPVEETYCSEAWKAQSAEVRRIDESRPDELGLWDYDYWIQGQDWQRLSFKDVKVRDVTKGRTAHAELTLHNSGDNNVRLTLVWERGNWYIDDLFDDSNPLGIRKAQTEYIRESR